MEEILASIRQIISEDGEGADNAGPAKADAAGDKAASDSGEEAAAPVAAEADKDDPDSMANKDPEMDTRAEADLAKAEEAFSSDDEPADDDGAAAAASGDDNSGEGEPDSEASDDPTDNVADVFAAISDTESDVEESISMAMPAQSKHPSPAPIDDENLLSEDSDEVVHGAFSALAHTILAQNARTLEDLVSEMLQPMLKGWLDDNLPSLVERLVKEEIDRVSRGRR
jgi:cell pole-organizing protein PopZ